jgi:glycosyltransferase involved in cell wall biosynthesis
LLKVLVVTRARFRHARGVELILQQTLPYLGGLARVAIAALDEPDEPFLTLTRRHDIPVSQVPYVNRGWFVRHPRRTVDAVMALSDRHGCQLILLYWEIWDLMRHLSAECLRHRIPFATYLHAMPFVNAPAAPRRSLTLDAMRRVLHERSWNATWHTALRRPGARSVFARTAVLSANATVSGLVANYLPDTRVWEVSPPAAAVPPDGVERPAGKEFDLVYLAKLERGKGVHLLPRILAQVVARRPGCRLLVIGSFDKPEEERRFARLARRYGVQRHVVLAGWLEGADKWRALASARLMIYPTVDSDTLCLSMLEALGIGVPVVVHDTHFVRMAYRSAAVHPVERFRPEKMAAAVTEILADPDRLAAMVEAAKRFVDGMPSWRAVGESQVRQLRAIVDHHAGLASTG